MKDNSLKTDMFNDIRPLINIIDQLKDYGLQKQISLPRITVLGTQSSGKSSLLQNIVGLDFLPRGSGIVTRRPLELRLVHLQKRQIQNKPYAIFQNDQAHKKFTNFIQVRNHIKKLTDDVAGKDTDIVDDPIKLKIFSMDCPDLTIIDLPGITRIDPNNVKDVHKITTEMAKKYCTDKKTIILCVIPANQDLSTSDGLKLARQWDPLGERTIGVVTKIDIMDKGTSAAKILRNEQIFLKLGYIGVVNRAQQDINNNVSVDVSLKNQAKYFNDHPQYKLLPQKLKGTWSLTHKLSQQLVQAIKNSLPEILKQVQTKLQKLNIQLDEMGIPPPASVRQKSSYLLNLIAQFSNDYKNTLSGRYISNSRSNVQKGTGAVIKQKFKDIFQQYTNDYQCSSNYDDNFIQSSMRSHQGDQISGFFSMECFKSLLVPQLSKLKQPIHFVLDYIYQELLQLAGQLNTKVFFRFPDLLGIVSEATNKKLLELKDQTETLLGTVMAAQISTVFTNDTLYLSSKDEILTKAANNVTIQTENLLVEQIRKRLDDYFKIVVLVLNDVIPKIIGYFLVKQSQQTLQMAILELLGESKDAEQKRKRLRSRVQTLSKSLKALKRDPTAQKIIQNLQNGENDDKQ